ncbi:MAG: hypothetical protein FWH03_06245 [Firmicutes bacterium]|nr:hypothetical protein [Bacillota bacterium]
MESLQLKKAIFNPTEIVLLKKKGNITIHVDEIEWIYYRKPTLLNWLFATWFPGVFNIFLKNEHGGKWFALRIKYKDFCKLPGVYQEMANSSTLYAQ